MNNIDKKKKVLFAITKSNWGGAQKYVYDLATSLPKDGYEVVVAFGGSGILKDRLQNKSVRTISIDGLARDVSISKDWESFKRISTILNEEKPDIIHLNSSKMAGIGVLASRIYNLRIHISSIKNKTDLKPVKIIYTSHGWPFNEDRSLLQKKIIKFLSWITVILSHKTIAVSNYERSSISNLPFVSRKIVVIYNGITPPNFIPKASSREILLGGPKAIAYGKYLWLGTIGELTDNKNYFSAINAVSYYNETHDTKIFYTIIGNGELKDELDNFIESNNLQETVFLTSSDKFKFNAETDLILRSKASSLLPAFDAFLLPSKKEGLPYTLIEAGFAGLPSITTPVGGTREIIEDGVTGIISDGCDPDSISQSLSRVFSETSSSIDIGIKLQEYVTTKFRIDIMIEETLAQY